MQKNISDIWQRFSCLLDEGIAKNTKDIFTLSFFKIQAINFEMHMDRLDKSENIVGI